MSMKVERTTRVRSSEVGNKNDNGLESDNKRNHGHGLIRPHITLGID